MEAVRFMPKLQKNESKIHYKHKVVILAYCAEKRSMGEIISMFKEINMVISKRSLRYVLKDLSDKGLIVKYPNLLDLRSFYYKTSDIVKQSDGGFETWV